MAQEQHGTYPQNRSPGRSCSLFAPPLTRVRATGLARGQDPVAIEENALVHTKRRPLLLPLCIEITFRRITRQPGRAGSRRLGQLLRAGKGTGRKADGRARCGRIRRRSCRRRMERRLGKGAAMKRSKRENRGSLRLAGEKADGLESVTLLRPESLSRRPVCPSGTTLGTFPAQPGACPQKRRQAPAYPRWRYAGKRGGHTGL